MGNLVDTIKVNPSRPRLETSWAEMDHTPNEVGHGEGEETGASFTNGLFETTSQKLIPEEVMELLLSYVQVKDILAVSQVFGNLYLRLLINCELQ